MKHINKDELYKNLGDFLKSKGLSLGKGSYAQKIRHGCTFLTDAINVTQKGITRAKSEVDTNIDKMKKVIKKKSPKASVKTTSSQAATKKAVAKKKKAAPKVAKKKKATPKKKTVAKKPRTSK